MAGPQRITIKPATDQSWPVPLRPAKTIRIGAASEAGKAVKP